MVIVFDTAGDTACIGLWENEWVAREDFVAGRELNKLIIQKLNDILQHEKCEGGKALKGVVVNAGPGSFTGLRIGLSVANTLAYSKDIPIVGVIDKNDIDQIANIGESMLKSVGPDFSGPIVPHYGAEPHITKPKQ